jgi:diacylglycerol kinase
MALTPQAARTLKLFTAVAPVGVGIQAMFFSEYDIDGFERKDHIFTDVQKDARNWIDQNIYGIDAASMRRNFQQKSAALDVGRSMVTWINLEWEQLLCICIHVIESINSNVEEMRDRTNKFHHLSSYNAVCSISAGVKIPPLST